MRRLSCLSCIARGLAAGVLLHVLAAPANAQLVVPDYKLTAPAWLQRAPAWTDSELSPRQDLLSLGPVRLAAAASSSGNGLSLEAGEKWFALARIGRSLESDMMSVGGGYRFAGGDALSMQVTRQLGQERLGLALRYDLRTSYLRLGYEQQHSPGATDRLRFSAGLRF
jgi:hypothetical protein